MGACAGDLLSELYHGSQKNCLSSTVVPLKNQYLSWPNLRMSFSLILVLLLKKKCAAFDFLFVFMSQALKRGSKANAVKP